MTELPAGGIADRRALREAIIVLVLSAVLAAGSALLHPGAPGWFLVRETTRWDIRLDEIGRVLGPDAERVVWIDSRKDELYENGHLDGAILLNRERWGELVAENQDRLQEALEHPVIVYCDGRGCERSREIAERLRQLIGLEPVYVLKGDWRKLR